MGTKLLTLSVLLLSVGSLAAGDPPRHGAAAPQDPRFDFLKQLEGLWIGPPTGEGTQPMRFEFRVTSAGHAVEEREMIGTPMEMLTLYHMDGDDLVATHFCVLGNRPHLTAAKRVVEDTLTFGCAATPGGAGSHDEEHVHGWSMRLDADGRLVYSAELVRNGTVTEAPKFVLTRQRETASR